MKSNNLKKKIINIKKKFVIKKQNQNYLIVIIKRIFNKRIYQVKSNKKLCS